MQWTGRPTRRSISAPPTITIQPCMRPRQPPAVPGSTHSTTAHLQHDLLEERVRDFAHERQRAQRRRQRRRVPRSAPLSQCPLLALHCLHTSATRCLGTAHLHIAGSIPAAHIPRYLRRDGLTPPAPLHPCHTCIRSSDLQRTVSATPQLRGRSTADMTPSISEPLGYRMPAAVRSQRCGHAVHVADARQAGEAREGHQPVVP